MMLKTFVFLCISIPLLQAIPLKKEEAGTNSKALFLDQQQMKRTIPDCESSYVENSGCSSWINLCQNSLYEAFMRENCKITCGLCKALPTPPPTPPPYETPENIAFDDSECLAAHNSERSKHGVPALGWDANLASGSATWALHLAQFNSTVQLEHSAANGAYGENIYYSATSAVGTVASCNNAVQSWYAEISDYDYDNPGYSAGIGHFTQVVWKSTTQVGVGMAAVTKGGFTHTFVVARYTPPGNMVGEFSENVLPLVK